MPVPNRKDINLPRALIGRDPRNQAHLVEALQILAKIQGGIVVTEQIERELRQFGVVLKKPKYVKKSTDADAVVGGFFFLERDMHFPDGIISGCHDCGTPIEIRPHNAAVKMRLCAFCACNRALKEYWSQRRPTQE